VQEGWGKSCSDWVMQRRDEASRVFAFSLRLGPIRSCFFELDVFDLCNVRAYEPTEV
jgi:hypothetical protein